MTQWRWAAILARRLADAPASRNGRLWPARPARRKFRPDATFIASLKEDIHTLPGGPNRRSIRRPRPRAGERAKSRQMLTHATSIFSKNFSPAISSARNARDANAGVARQRERSKTGFGEYAQRFRRERHWLDYPQRADRSGPKGHRRRFARSPSQTAAPSPTWARPLSRAQPRPSRRWRLQSRSHRENLPNSKANAVSSR
jgi:hypothetical protein